MEEPCREEAPGSFGGWVQRRRSGMGNAAALVWLAFVLYPLVAALTGHGSPGRQAASVAGAAAFVGAYVWMVLRAAGHRMERLAWALCWLLVALATAMTLALSPDWGFLFTYCGACLVMMAPQGWSFPAAAGATAMAAGCCLVAGGSGGQALAFGATTMGIGLLMMLLRDLRVRNAELQQARAELALSAVARERERFARDLHDLLGHTLSVIALKAELAGRLLPARPEEALREMGEVEAVARSALVEVRQAVSGYRRPTLAGELAGARMALSTAGVAVEVERAPVALDPEVEAVLAWAVREGATNVIRHSGARRCTIRVLAGLDGCTVEVLDDGDGRGRADTPPSASGGHGLSGLRERAGAIGGRVEAGPAQPRGFRLAVSAPPGGAPSGAIGPSEPGSAIASEESLPVVQGRP